MVLKAFEGVYAAASISGPPSTGDYIWDRGFRFLAWAGAWIILALVAYILWKIGGQALPAMTKYGLSFVTSSTWDGSKEQFGVLPQIWGTLYSSILALIIGGFFGVTIAIFLTQDFLAPRLAVIFRTIVDLLAAIPSVVYGLWGIYVVIPTLRPLANWLNTELGWIPFFGTSLSGPGMLPAAIVLAIMVLPTIAAVSQDALRRIPYKVKEAAYGMGTTRWEAILGVMLQSDQPVPVLSCRHPGFLAGLKLPRGRADQNRGLDVCRHGVDGDDDDGQYHRPVHHELIHAEV